MKAGCLLLLFVLANLLYGLFMALREAGLISANPNPATLERWLNS